MPAIGAVIAITENDRILLTQRDDFAVAAYHTVRGSRHSDR